MKFRRRALPVVPSMAEKGVTEVRLGGRKLLNIVPYWSEGLYLCLSVGNCRRAS